MNDLIFEIGLILNDLPRSERAFAQAVIESPSALEGATLQKLAYDTGTSDATIIRFCKRLGFSGINDFKIAITEAGKTCQNVDGHLFSNLDTTDIMKEVYRSTLYILNDTMAQATDKYDKAVMSLLNAQSINFFGIGEAYITCMYGKLKFSKLGKMCNADSDPFQQYITAENLGLKDVAIAISYDGATKTICDCMRIARMNKATTISITRKHPSVLLRYTEMPLYSVINDLSEAGEKASRRISDQFIIDILYYAMVNKMGYDEYSSQISGVHRAVSKLQIGKEKNKSNKL